MSANPDLQQQLAALTNSARTLGTSLASAAQQLQANGIPIAETLLQQLATYRQQYERLKASAGANGEPSLREISVAIARAASASDSLSLLERVERIAHASDPRFAPLVACQQQARDLRQRLSSGAQAPAEVEPFSRLLELIERGEALDDERWAACHDAIASRFGSSLAAVVSRGKLRISPQASPQTVSQTSPQTDASQGKIYQVGSPASPQTSPQTSPQSNLVVLPREEKDDVIVFGDPSAVQAAPDAAISSPAAPTIVGLSVTVHLQGVGDRAFRQNEYAGTRGEFRILEGFSLRLDPPIPGLSLQYSAHVEDLGDTEWVTEGSFVGTRGQSKRLEGFSVRLAGPEAANYRVFYNAHVSRVGDTEIASDGAYCGTRGRALPVEGMKVWIDRVTAPQTPATQTPAIQTPAIQSPAIQVPAVPPEDLAATVRVPNKPQPDRMTSSSDDEDVIIFGPALSDEASTAPSPTEIGAAIGLRIVAHLQGVGDRTFREKEYAGTRGESRPVEGFEIAIDPPIPGLSLHYMGHVAGTGDTPWLQAGQFLGSRGQGKQIEGFAIRLDGPEAPKYNVFYTAHVARMGDTQKFGNGRYCGTKGQSLPIEGIQVWIEPKK